MTRTTFYNIVVILLMATTMNNAVATGPEESPSSPGMVVAVDCSGSLRASFGKIRENIAGLLRCLPDGSRFALVRFDTSAQEFGRTRHLTETQREMMQKRVRSLQARGQWTNFEVAIEQVRASAQALGSPVLIVVFTDAESDPSPGRSFHRLDELLHEVFTGEDGHRVLVVLPKRNVQSRVQSRGPVQVSILEDLSPERILLHVPAVFAPAPPEPEPVAEAPPPSEPEPAVVTASLAEPIPEEEKAWPTPWGLVVAGLAALLMLAALAFLGWQDWNRANRLRIARQKQPSKHSLQYNLVARCGKTTFNLGPKDRVKRVRIGSTPGCDVQLVSPKDKKQEVVLTRNRSGRFQLHNRSGPCIKANGTQVPHGKTREVRLPTNLVMGEELSVALILVPQRAPARPPAATSAKTKENKNVSNSQ